MIRPTLHHVNLKTTRLQEMIDWYAVVIGGKVIFQSTGGASATDNPIQIAFMSNDRAAQRIVFMAVRGLREDPEQFVHVGLHHIAFEYDSFDDLMSSFARLKQLGIEPGVCLNHGLTTSLYYSDPDQNAVELQADNFGNWDASTEWMRTSEDFRQNPIGGSEYFSTRTAFLPPTRPVRRSSSCKKTRTREYIPLRSRQTCISLRSADFPVSLLFAVSYTIARSRLSHLRHRHHKSAPVTDL